MSGLKPPPIDRKGAAAAAARFATIAQPDVAYAVVDTPIGPVVGARTKRGLAYLGYEDSARSLDEIVESLARRLSPRILEAPARLDDVRRELDEYFAQRRTGFDVPIDWSLTGEFTRRVLQATARIPFGATATYGQIAAKAGNPRAARATGRSLNVNPIPIIVPCHRVVGADGRLVGYGGGLPRKETLLRIEGALP